MSANAVDSTASSEGLDSPGCSSVGDTSSSVSLELSAGTVELVQNPASPYV